MISICDLLWPTRPDLKWSTTLTYHAFLPAYLLQVPATENSQAFPATTSSNHDTSPKLILFNHCSSSTWSLSSCINITRYLSHHVACKSSERGCPVWYLPIPSRVTQDLSFKNIFQLSTVFTFCFSLVPNPFSSQFKPAISLLPFLLH